VVGYYPHLRRYRRGDFQTLSVARPWELRLTVRLRPPQLKPSRVFASIRDACARLGDLRLPNLPGGHIAQIPHDETQPSRCEWLWRRVRWKQQRRYSCSTYCIDGNGDEWFGGPCHLEQQVYPCNPGGHLERRNKSTTGGKHYPEGAGKVDFQNNILMASRDR
jgi:hypothetical protein